MFSPIGAPSFGLSALFPPSSSSFSYQSDRPRRIFEERREGFSGSSGSLGSRFGPCPAFGESDDEYWDADELGGERGVRNTEKLDRDTLFNLEIPECERLAVICPISSFGEGYGGGEEAGAGLTRTQNTGTAEKAPPLPTLPLSALLHICVRHVALAELGGFEASSIAGNEVAEDQGGGGGGDASTGAGGQAKVTTPTWDKDEPLVLLVSGTPLEKIRTALLEEANAWVAGLGVGVGVGGGAEAGDGAGSWEGRAREFERTMERVEIRYTPTRAHLLALLALLRTSTLPGVLTAQEPGSESPEHLRTVVLPRRPTLVVLTGVSDLVESSPSVEALETIFAHVQDTVDYFSTGAFSPNLASSSDASSPISSNSSNPKRKRTRTQLILFDSKLGSLSLPIIGSGIDSSAFASTSTSTSTSGSESRAGEPKGANRRYGYQPAASRGDLADADDKTAAATAGGEPSADTSTRTSMPSVRLDKVVERWFEWIIRIEPAVPSSNQPRSLARTHILTIRPSAFRPPAFLPSLPTSRASASASKQEHAGRAEKRTREGDAIPNRILKGGGGKESGEKGWHVRVPLVFTREGQ